MSATEARQSRGFLNNNPGNIDRARDVWEGEIRDPTLCTNEIQKLELTRGRFCVFVDAEHGIRAMVKNLRAYRDRLGLQTVRQFICRWAPPNENNTAAYIANVAYACAVGTDFPVNIEQRHAMRALIDAIIRVECGGMPYPPDVLERGMDLAGVPSDDLGAAPVG